uniref:BACK domain-containing protein n=1 Tax=Schistosoma mansoni TaxID=6183 RepID=A0A5K4FB65_SCHMA
MSDCFFISTLPEYLLDRKLIINNNHIHSINGYKLAKSSIIFKNQLIKLRQIELKNDPLHLNSLSNLKLQPFIIHYSNIYALECLLSFIHCNEETRYQLLYNNIQLSTIYSLLKVGLYFQIYEFTNDCLDIVQSKLNIENCLNFWKISKKKLFFKKISKFYKIIFNYLLIHFNEINKTKNFLKLNLIELKILLKNDLLNCLNEKYLFNIIIKWINYKKIERELYIYDLLTCLRLGRLSNEDLNDLSKHPIIQKMWNSCNHLLLMARSPNKELIPYLDSSLTSRLEDEMELYTYLHKPRFPYTAIFVIGGWEGNVEYSYLGPSKVIQVYNSRADSWRRDKLTLNVGHAYSGCVLHKTQIYIIGGYVPSGPTQTLKVFELRNLKWKILSPMHEKRNYVCACSLNNYIYAIGGHNGKIRLRSVERYDIEQKQWFFVSPMHQVRSDAGAHSFSGYIYVVGGFDGDHFHDSVEMYDPRTDQWSLVAPMNSIRSGVSVIVYDHYLYAIGGNDGSQRLRTVERYNPNTNRWQMMPSMIHKRSNFCVTTLDEMIYVIGGWNDETNSTISSVERWSPNSSTHWEPVRELHIPASASCCCTVTGINLLLNFI